MSRPIFILSFFVASIASALDLPEACRVKNKEPGYCAWACIESAGRRHGIAALENLVENREKDHDIVIEAATEDIVIAKHLGYLVEIERKMKELNVGCLVQPSDANKDTKILKYVNTHGCTISVWDGKARYSHAILLLELTDKGVKYYDSNYPDKITVQTRKWFDEHWTGYAIVVWDKKWEKK